LLQGFDLAAATFAAYAPLHEMLAVIGKDPIAVFPEPRPSANNTSNARVRRRRCAHDCEATASCEVCKANELDRPFAQQALENNHARLFIHCAAGVHRAPMMTLAVLCAQGWDLGTAVETISSRRPLADFAEVYVNSVEQFLQQQLTQEISKPLVE